jgi:hypothetical protein
MKNGKSLLDVEDAVIASGESTDDLHLISRFDLVSVISKEDGFFAAWNATGSHF